MKFFLNILTQKQLDRRIAEVIRLERDVARAEAETERRKCEQRVVDTARRVKAETQRISNIMLSELLYKNAKLSGVLVDKRKALLSLSEGDKR